MQEIERERRRRLGSALEARSRAAQGARAERSEALEPWVVGRPFSIKPTYGAPNTKGTHGSAGFFAAETAALPGVP